MFFGMCNSPATFQSMMDEIFADMTDEGIVIIYMDDVFIFAPDEITLTENTKRVLARLQENDLFLKPAKCEFNKTKIEYLGMVIEEGKISMDPGKLKGIQDWPTPTTVKQVRCKVVIPRGTGRSYSIRWRSEMRVTDETKVTDGLMSGRKDGTYSAGVKDSASAYVLCPRSTEQLCLSIWKGIGNAEKDLEGF